MSPSNSSANPKYDVINEANVAAQNAVAADIDNDSAETKEQEQVKAEAIQLWAQKMLHQLNRKNTPFDGRIKKRKKLKAKASRKEAKARRKQKKLKKAK